jgi:hypothetical protein
MTTIPQHPRYGFYYYPDADHYPEEAALTWIPELQALGAGWLTLLASSERVIPENFLQPLIANGIQPIIHLPLDTRQAGISNDLEICIKAYAHWGVKYIAFFDRPNQIKNWGASAWGQNNLIDRFIKLFLPVAGAAVSAGLTPVFPPLEPGGDYWDTAFLFSTLQGIQRMGHQDLLDRLVISAYAWAGNRSPNWGAGGPERWPASRPYETPENSEDQLGFRIFDWYVAISQAAIGRTLPIVLLGAGSKIGDQTDLRSPAVDAQAHAWQNMTIVKMMEGIGKEYDAVPPELLTCNFWVLSAGRGDPEARNAWYGPDQDTLPVVEQLKQWVANKGASPTPAGKHKSTETYNFGNPRPIAHYLLLPTFEWGPADWHLDAIRQFINKYQPTIGFSPAEASHAKKVTVIGGATSVPESIIDDLLAAGCVVEQISGDGMNIASRLASRSKNSTLKA